MKEYTRELDKLWKSALKKAGILEGNVKEETTGPRIHIEEKDKNTRDNFSYDALIKMKVTKLANAVKTRKPDIQIPEPFRFGTFPSLYSNGCSI